MYKDFKDIFSYQQEDDIKQSILNAELDTSGEIRVHIDTICEGDVKEKAREIFDVLNMQKTELRNGVLFYLAVKNRKFAIIRDIGIEEVVPDEFWQNVKQVLLNNFRKEKFVEGLCEAIAMTGDRLTMDFPHHMNEVNELPDEISYGDFK